jgi:hypothetical protein
MGGNQEEGEVGGEGELGASWAFRKGQVGW